jgi:tetratricopeptide (TPR) repeat protein
MGVAYSFRKKHKKAIECYQKTLMLSKNFAMAYCNLGKEYSEKGKASEAIRHYSAAIGIAGPIDSADNSYRARLLSTACNNRGYEHFKNKDYTQADMDFRDALRLDPNYAVALANRGLNYIEMSRTEGNRKKAMGFLNAAKKLIDKAIEIDPFFATAYLARHELYRELGMKKEAASEYAAYKKIRREGKRAPNTACYAEGATEERKTK